MKYFTQFLFLLLPLFAISQVNLNQGLRAYYPFSGNANDVSGNNNHPVFNNATLTADRLGNANSAYHFNGTDNYMKVLNSPSLNMTNQMSISLWVKASAYYTGPCYNNMLVMKGDADYLPGNYSLRFSDAYTGCTNPTTTQERFYGPGVIAQLPLVQLNQWYSVVCTYDGNMAKIYVDCILRDSAVVSITSFTNSYDLFLGHLNNAQYPYWLNGDLDEVRIYDRALNQDEVKVLGGCTTELTCNNWLNTTAANAFFSIGDLDISGNQITVEALINRTQPYLPGGGNDTEGDIVSKHTDFNDINYLLRPNHAYITTTNGFFGTPDVCDLELNKTYHVAMVYNGSTLKFYRNGFLMSQINATGNLFQNNLNTQIGHYAATVWNTQFLGFINEIRIWNVARTQAQIQTYMNSSLPSPSTQTGLQAYYTFDNLLNKQGNAAWNGTLNGAATINNINTSCSFIPDSCAIATACDTWLQTPATSSYVTVGDLDVAGNQLTVEANFNRTAPVNTVGGYGFLVSKHTGPTNINYALWTGGCAITTVNGEVFATENCEIELNKTYHVAMVYNGSSLKFYRNGFLHSQTPASGNLILNDLVTAIAQNAVPGAPVIYPFTGYMNEVRIWNVARTQVQLQTYMNSSLPNPTSQAGLLGYYIFDNLQNKQGNAIYNATLAGAATINSTNTSCSFFADSCATVIPPTIISGVINDYSPITAVNLCDNKFTIEDATNYKTGDTVLLIQMKGAIIDTTNTANFGTIIDYKNAGNYEFNYIKAKTGNVIELKNKLTRQYDIPYGKVQLIRVPYYINAKVEATTSLSCYPWDGNKGGVLVINVRDTFKILGVIDVSSKGFRSGSVGNNLTNNSNCFAANYSYPDISPLGAEKGEGISTILNKKGKGALSNGGGGGQDHNSGGAGGGNGGNGGTGGNQYENCLNNPFDNGGRPGKNLAYSNAQNKIFMGGGGGSGHANNTAGFEPMGGNGGGIVIINADCLDGHILSYGDNGLSCISNTANDNCNEGMGGGGAGGTILLKFNTLINGIVAETTGGSGANVSYAAPTAPADLNKHGPGGGGSGGVVWISKPSLPSGAYAWVSGGSNGRNLWYGDDPWGATSGQNGLILTNLLLPVDTLPFTKNIDSVRIKDSSTSCLALNFTGFGYTNTNPIAGWNWYFGDGGTANTQNTSHTYATAGTYLVKLVVTDINGCKDSITRNVISNTISVNAGTDSSFCGGPVSVQLNGTVGGSGNYSWTPAVYLNNSSVSNPVATVNTTTTFYLSVTNASGCSGQDSVTIHVNAAPVVQTLGDTAICKGAVLMLSTTSGLGSYHWSPGIYVNDSTIANPLFTDTVPRTLIVTGNNGTCFSSDTINISVKPLPVVYAGADTAICNAQLIGLSATGAITYNWSPAIFLSNPNIANPVFSGNASTTYFLTGTGANGCEGKDTVSIQVNNSNTLIKPPNKSFCSKESVQLDGNNGNTVRYLWAPSTYLNNNSISNPVANPPVTTTYIVTITDTTCNFDSSFNVIVTVNPLPVVTASRSNDIDCAFKNARLSANGASQYSWQPPGTLSSSNIANPVATPLTNTIYVVTGTDINGCKNIDSVTVLVKSGINGYDIPNSFSPNGDNNNDCFGIKHWGDAQHVVFIIFNRWGEKVFESSNVNNCWDGSFKGLPAEVGNYIYYASARTSCGDLVRKGNVLLFR